MSYSDNNVPQKSVANQFSTEQARQTGIKFRELSDLLIKYRYQEWNHLTEKEQYFMENIEWSLINFCSDFTDSGIFLDSEGSNSLFITIKDRMDNAQKQVQGIIGTGKESNEKIMTLGGWALKLGAAIASKKSGQVKALLNNYNVPSDSEKQVSYANPEVSRKIGLNFATVSDAILKFHYNNWDQLSEDEKNQLLNMEMTILNYNSNFGGLGIQTNSRETQSLFIPILHITETYLKAMDALSILDVTSLDKVMALGKTVMDLGAAITQEDVSGIEKFLDQKVPGKDFKLGRDIGLKFRHMATLLLQYRYRNWDTLTKKEKYNLENIEFTLTNFNSDFAVFGVSIAPNKGSALIEEVDSKIQQLSSAMSNDDLGYEQFFSQGVSALKLGAAILTENHDLIKKFSAPALKGPDGVLGDNAAKLSRNIALKMRIISNIMLKQTYDHWNRFTSKDRGHLGNIEWTLMNYTSNFSVLGIRLDTGQSDKILACAAVTLDRYIETIKALDPGEPKDKEKLFQLGTESLKAGAVLTTEDVLAINAMLGNCN
jgi:hypothetical protein